MNPSNNNTEGAVVLPDTPLHVFNLDGLVQTIDFVPTFTPGRFIDQFLIVTAGGSSRAYLFDTSSRTWKYTSLT